MGLKSDLLKVGSSNAIVLLSSLVNGFFLPFVLTINGYANYKTYILYASFIGFLHFGFVDGINVKYGGIRKDEVNFREFEKYHLLFIITQVFSTLFILAAYLLINNDIFLYVCFAIIPINIQSFFLSYYQAIGEFKTYAKAIIVVPIFTIIFTITVYLLSYNKFHYYVFAQIASYYISAIYLEYHHFNYLKKVNDISFFNSLKNFTKTFYVSYSIYLKIFVSGFFIMVGNLAFVLFFDIGKWMSKLFTSPEGFAIYSFSLSLIGFIVIFVSSVNKTFYPYLHRNRKRVTIIKFRNLFYVLGTASIPLFFPLKWLVINYLPKYQASLSLTAILITTIPGIFIIKSLYINLYKVEKKESKFLYDTITYLLIALLVNAMFYYIYPELISIAFASVLSIYFWAIFPANVNYISRWDKMKEVSFLIIIYSFFAFLYNLELNVILSMSAMMIFVSIINWVYYREVVVSVIKRKL
ncbi:MAG: hypothetical protein HUJ22_00320 [Gracilimonas sp.]|uniref:hypothetical protein n=1 Tax=Gracilimonas sp. TaxID=1974203 RepID=UPI00199FE339|nr:hypothetical protein [Gracilimonas sp.]MBD3614983.1 hypothetical protein [Gracilimonas sp.]